jgi:hypothetical protein
MRLPHDGAYQALDARGAWHFRGMQDSQRAELSARTVLSRGSAGEVPGTCRHQGAWHLRGGVASQGAELDTRKVLARHVARLSARHLSMFDNESEI